MSPVVLFAGAPSGGHLFPAIALAREIAGTWGVSPHFLTGGDPREERILAAGEFPAHLVPGAASRRPGALVGRWRRLRRLFDEIGPQAVIGLGGAPTLLPGVLGRLRSIPLFLLEQNRVVGRANRLLLPLATRIFLSFDDTRGGLRMSRRRALRPGGPGRPGVRPAPVPGGPPHLLVLGGSQGAEGVNRAMEEALPLLPAALRRELRVTHLCGPGKRASLEESYQRAGLHAEIVEFIPDPATRLAAATLVLGRAGGSTFAETCAIGRGALLIPYPHHRDRHQLWNARALESAGAGRIVGEDSSPTELAHCLARLLSDPAACREMARRAAALGRPRAAVQVASVIATHLSCGLREATQVDPGSLLPLCPM
ncbi:MAG: glycosyltransferase, partial [Planctomycetota bacterium]